jgi:Flp pilus assembly protein TadG
MSPRAALSRLARRFVDDARGLSAVEFALILPLMLTLYLGATEVSQAISANRKVTLVSRTVADLSSQVASISNANMDNILNASAAIAAPFAGSKLKVTVSCVKIDANNRATIEWSETLTGSTRSTNTVHTVGSTVTTLPGTLNVANTWLIWTEAQYDYTPVIGYTITGTLALKDQMYMRPRLSDTVTRTAS